MHTRRGRSPKVVPWAQRRAQYLARFIPEPLLASPERVAVNLAAVVLGVAALWPPPGGVADQWPTWFRVEWSLGMALAGLAGLYGTWTSYRPAERLGAGLFALCATAYAAQASYSFGITVISTVTLFGLLVVAQLLRLIRSLAASGLIARRIQKETAQRLER